MGRAGERQHVCARVAMDWPYTANASLRLYAEEAAQRAGLAPGNITAVRHGSPLVQVSLQLGFDGARVLALRDAEHAVDHHLAKLRLAVDDALQFGRNR